MCKVPGCPNPSVMAHDLCPMHYMRERRLGEIGPASKYKPGPKPRPRPVDPYARIRELEAELRDQPERGTTTADATKEKVQSQSKSNAATQAEIKQLTAEVARLKTENATLKTANAQLRANQSSGTDSAELARLRARIKQLEQVIIHGASAQREHHPPAELPEQIHRLRALWKSGRDKFRSFFTVLSDVRQQIGNEDLELWCARDLRIGLSIITKATGILSDVDAAKFKEELAKVNVMPSMSAQQKLDAAIRAHQRHLDRQFEQRVLTECDRRLNEKRN
jgi:hypothetical protein